jgi:hypothetical protein
MPKNPDGGFTIDDSTLFLPIKRKVKEEQKKSPATKKPLRRVTKKSFSKLDINHKLFEQLNKIYPIWWRNIKGDKDLYIDVRKDNYINVYYNGGSIMKLSYARGFKAEMHFEYIPLKTQRNYVSYEFMNDDVELNTKGIEILTMHNFNAEHLKALKKRISKFNPSSSEKGIQGDFVIKNSGFLDTEFQYDNNRIDLVWIDAMTKTIYFIELKTKDDSRLSLDNNHHGNDGAERIDAQLRKYGSFINDHYDDLLDYYMNIFMIKKKLGILKGELNELKSLDAFRIEKRPILLIGDCTQSWIERNYSEINSGIKDIAFGCFYQGKTTRDFYIPPKTIRNKYLFE